MEDYSETAVGTIRKLQSDRLIHALRKCVLICLLELLVAQGRANFDHFPFFLRISHFFIGKLRTEATCTFFRPTSFFAPCALSMDFAHFRQMLGIKPQNV